MGDLLGYLFFFGLPIVCFYIIFRKIYIILKGKNVKCKYSKEEIQKCQMIAKTMFGQIITENEACEILRNAERKAGRKF